MPFSFKIAVHTRSSDMAAFISRCILWHTIHTANERGFHMDAKTVLESAHQIKSDILTHRRTLHSNPEAGAHLPQTTAYVMQQLTRLGYQPVEICPSGIVAEITGEDTGRCILLRADMDALPIREQSGLDFQSTNGNMHACGHDMHTAMLLGAAQLLRKHQKALKGTVKLVFQPDEESLTGAKKMLAAGVLENPPPQAGMALHVISNVPSGMVLCGKGRFMAGCSHFRLRVTGVGCHGAMPETGIDPINIAAHIYLGLQALIAREISPTTPASITVGKFSGGSNSNIIPQEVILEGTIRSFDKDVSAKLLQRVRQIAENTASVFLGNASLEVFADTPPLHNDEELMAKIQAFAGTLLGNQAVYAVEQGGMGSEDFSVYTEALPCAYLLLGAGTQKEDSRYGLPMHNEKIIFNEDILTQGAALYAWCALSWLEQAE